MRRSRPSAGRRTALVIGVVCLLASCSGSNSGNTDIATLQDDLASTGLSCTTAAGPPSTVGLQALDRFNATETVDCTIDGISIRINRWESDSAAEDALRAKRPTMCGVGQKSVTYIADDNWMIAVSGEAESASVKKTVAVIGDKLGVDPTTINCNTTPPNQLTPLPS